MDISWKFRLSERMASISQVSLQENISFWSEQKKFWFYGYQTLKPQKAVIWGNKVALTLRIAPLNTPIEKLPIAPIKPPAPQRSQLAAEKQILLDGLLQKLKTLQASVPPSLADENVYWNYINPEVFVTTFQQMVTKWNDREVKLIDKFPQVIPLLITIYDAVREMHLPDELMRDDTQFSLGLARLLQYVEIIKENAEIHHQILPPEIENLKLLLDQLTDCMIEGGHKIFGVPPAVDQVLRTEFVEKKVTAVYNRDFTTDKRLDILKQLIEDPCADTDDQIELLEESIKFIWKEVEQEPKKPACPHSRLISDHLEGIRCYLKELEEEGEDAWQLRMAEEMLDSANSWRESGDMPVLSKEEFSSLIFLTDLCIESAQMEDGTISYKMELYFNDKNDSFAGHFMYAKVVNKEVEEITLMG